MGGTLGPLHGSGYEALDRKGQHRGSQI